MHPKEIGQSYDASAHIWREPPIQSDGVPQLERVGKTKTGYHLSFCRHRLSLPLFFASSIADKRIQPLPDQ